MTNNQHTISVFEYDRLQVGEYYDGLRFTERHLQQLAQYLTRLGHSKYYSLIHKGIRFANYVGVLKVSNLTIQILPKIDQHPQLGKDKIQLILLDLLRYCKILHLETVPNSFVQLQKHSILDVYIAFFVHEVEKAMHYGLFRSYSRYPKNETTFRGQLMVEKQIRHNYNNRTRFYCKQFEYDFDHPFNRIIKAALLQCEGISANMFLRKKISFLLKYLPFEVGNFQKERDFYRVKKDKNTFKYTTILSYAQLILEQLAGDFRAGQEPIVGLFFDMNLLYEKFVYASLKQLENEQVTVKKQAQKVFWGKRKIKPDIVFSYQGKRYIIDTKWKTLSKPNPSMEDLRQVFVYCQYFDAVKGVLAYPKILNNTATINEPFQPYNNQQEAVNCQIIEINLIQNGKLNKSLGQQLLQQIVEVL